MGEIEDLSAQRGKFGWRWRDLMEKQKQKIKGLGPRPGEGILASQLSCGLGLGDAFQLPKEDLAGAVRLL